ncbi:hypothetical protein OPV22_033589 [Ensete ventricosum]|uniref:Uncharacterized protein n=1 Tax=Ensete ventricosum TaxID=4639 RepID=A0AAV8PUQ3_ENSVE|nr:hypothetical protein OPV22_033589 [Ensete ventricosum]
MSCQITQDLRGNLPSLSRPAKLPSSLINKTTASMVMETRGGRSSRKPSSDVVSGVIDRGAIALRIWRRNVGM